MMFFLYYMNERYWPGGCGSMYEVYIKAEEFRGHRMVKQHQLVNKVRVILIILIYVRIKYV